jgi:hypothetical protein
VLDAADAAAAVAAAAVVVAAAVVEIGCRRKYILRAFSNSVQMYTSKETICLHNSHDANDDHTGDR